jgi:V8-like Glu-specific endopeptidase
MYEELSLSLDTIRKALLVGALALAVLTASGGHTDSVAQARLADEQLDAMTAWSPPSDMIPDGQPIAGEPAEIVLAAPASVIGADDRQKAKATTGMPWRWIASLDVYFGTTKRSCSGFFVGPQTVATAGHCVFDQVLGWATDIRVVPGRDGGQEPLGSQFGLQFATNRGWTQQADPMLDFGAVLLPNADLQASVQGWFPYGVFTDEGLPNEVATLSGYPSAEPVPYECPMESGGLSACQQWFSSGTTNPVTWSESIECPPLPDPCFVIQKGIAGYSIDASSGQDGAPVWLFNGSQRAVAAIHTADGSEARCVTHVGGQNCGTLIAGTAAALLEF